MISWHTIGSFYCCSSKVLHVSQLFISFFTSAVMCGQNMLSLARRNVAWSPMCALCSYAKISFLILFGMTVLHPLKIMPFSYTSSSRKWKYGVISGDRSLFSSGHQFMILCLTPAKTSSAVVFVGAPSTSHLLFPLPLQSKLFPDPSDGSLSVLSLEPWIACLPQRFHARVCRPTKYHTAVIAGASFAGASPIVVGFEGSIDVVHSEKRKPQCLLPKKPVGF